MQTPEWATAVAEVEGLRPSFVHTVWLIGAGQRSNLRPTTDLAKLYLTSAGALTPLGLTLYQATEAARTAFEDCLTTFDRTHPFPPAPTPASHRTNPPSTEKD